MWTAVTLNTMVIAWVTGLTLALWVVQGHSKKNYSLRPEVVLPDDYVKEIQPPSAPGPVLLFFDILIVDINSINVEDMDFRVDMFVRQQWTEPRLQIPDAIFEDGEDYVTLPPEFFDKLWQPDPYIINSKVSEIAMLTHQFSSVTLYRNRTVRYSARMHAIVACQMEFQLYPMDIQLCPVYIESFSYVDRKLRLRWGEDGVAVNPALKLLQYNVGTPLELRETGGYRQEKDGNFSRLIVYFRFERQIGHHLIQTFAPSSLVVLLSWCGFWLGLDAVPGRVTLLVTCMLTLVTMFTGLKDIPPVAYVKALDVWMAACMLFVFAALVELVVVKVLDVQYQQQQREQVEQGASLGSLPLRIAAVEKGDTFSPAWEVMAGMASPGMAAGAPGARWRKVAVAAGSACGTACSTTAGCPHAHAAHTASAASGSAGSGSATGSAPASPGSDADSPPHVLLLPPLLPRPLLPRPTPTGAASSPVSSWTDRLVRAGSAGLGAGLGDGGQREHRQLWREIDRVSRLVFPALFLMFVSCYWPILLLRAYGV